MNNPHERLRHHVTGAVERGEAAAIAAVEGPRYIVVENAGYVGERDVYNGASWSEAMRWLEAHYDDEDRERLRPDICSEDSDGNRSYEC